MEPRRCPLCVRRTKEARSAQTVQVDAKHNTPRVRLMWQRMPNAVRSRASEEREQLPQVLQMCKVPRKTLLRMQKRVAQVGRDEGQLEMRRMLDVAGALRRIRHPDIERRNKPAPVLTSARRERQGVQLVGVRTMRIRPRRMPAAPERPANQNQQKES